MISELTMRITRNESILTAIIVVLFVALFVVILKPTIPTLQVIGVSLNPDTIDQNAFATLSFAIKNNDAMKQHSVHVGFDETDSNVTVYLGNQSLPTAYGISTGDRGSKAQFLWVTVQPSQVSTFSFRLTGTLSRGVSTTTYSIPVQFHDENITSFDNETVSLKVNQ